MTATTTTTTTTIITPTPPPKSRMKAEWHHLPWSELNWARKIVIALGLLQDPAGSPPPPVFPKHAPVPYHPVWAQHAWVFPYAVAPLLLHSAFTYYTGIPLPTFIAGILYTFYYLFFGSVLFNAHRRLGKKIGFFDGAVERDGIPDEDTTNVMLGLIRVFSSRMSFMFIFIYKPTEIPILSLSPWLPVQLGLLACILDFWFYWYHRLMHEVSFLWRFHRKHHTTKHPISVLSAYADHEQEFFDMLVIPALTWLVYPVNFSTWWICSIYVVYIESSGHSGLRGYFQNPTTFFLRYFGCELVLEDHDIHHRHGWRKSGNYGKQTRLWDALFGTMKPRIESHEMNVDWNHAVYLQ